MRRRQFVKSALAAGVATACVPVWARPPRGFAVPASGGGGGPPGGVFNFFISPTGDDNNNGLTPSTAWSITALNSKSTTYSGQNIGIIGDVSGTQTPIQYGTIGGTQTTLFSILNSQANQPVLNINGGTSGASTYLGSCNSSGVYTPRWAIIDASNPSGGAHATLDATILMGQNSEESTQVPKPGFVTLDALTIRNFSFCGIQFSNDGGSNISGCVIKNCEMYGSNTSQSNSNPGAIRLNNDLSTQILNCKIHDCTTASGGSYYTQAYPAIFSYATTQGLVITNCSLYNIIAIEQKDSTQDAVISYCYLDYGTFGTPGTSGGSGNYPWTYVGVNAAGRTTTFHHNIILGQVMGYGVDATKYSGAYVFYNNTMYPDISTQLLFMQPLTGSTFTAYNNIFYPRTSWITSEYGGISIVGATGTLVPQFDYNYYLTAPTFYNGAQINYATWQGAGFDAHSNTGGSPFSGTPTALTPSSFAVTGVAATMSTTGGPVGAVDGSGSIGSNF